VSFDFSALTDDISKATRFQFFLIISAEDLWEDLQHLALVQTAFKIIGRLYPNSKAANLWARFQGNVEKGLHKADYENPYYNNYTFCSHFYNPQTGLNFLNNPNSFPFASQSVLWSAAKLKVGDMFPDKTAVDCVKEYFTESLRHRISADGAELLGVAMHYLTDLSQPMHSADFIAGFGGGNFHGVFEQKIDTVASRLVPNMQLSRDEIEGIVHRYSSPGPLAIALATESNALFHNKVQKLLKEEWHSWWRGSDDSNITVENSTPLATEALRNGLRYTCALIRLWEQHVQ